MKTNVVFFGGADYGKSTVVGCIYAKATNKNMDDVEKFLKNELGSYYKPDYLYPFLVNPDALKSIRDPKYKKASSTGLSINGIHINYSNISLDGAFIDTPGHPEFSKYRDKGVSMSDIGVLCLAIGKVLSDDFIEVMHEHTELYAQFHSNQKLIYLLTMFDTVNYDEEKYHIACQKIKDHCRRIQVPRVRELPEFGASMSTTQLEPDYEVIIPVAVNFKTSERSSVNIFTRSDKTLWYDGPDLLRVIQMLTHGLQRDRDYE